MLSSGELCFARLPAVGGRGWGRERGGGAQVSFAFSQIPNRPRTLGLGTPALNHPSLFSVSKPEAVLFPVSDWHPPDHPQKEGDLGPAVHHVYEVRRDRGRED